MPKQFLEAGRIVGTHGVAGDLKIDSWCNCAEDLCALPELYLGEEKIRLDIKSMRPHKNIVLLRLNNIGNINEAMPYVGKTVYMNRDDFELDDDEYFIQDLIGLNVIDADNEDICYGTLSDVSFTGANDVYHIKKDGREYLIPCIPDVVIDTDIYAGVMKIRPIKGIFDDED
ncbi:MAG: 16S rRNA processing protein RimM [Clostridia bacterium]|nr:16S rRNA processing protein RimM [Clostridia bacterium]